MPLKPVFPSGRISLTAPRLVEPPAGVPSPCINVCQMDERSGYCQGCWRNIDEIALWSHLDDADKRAVLALIEQRRSAAPDPFAP